jgi:hypothetical protein
VARGRQLGILAVLLLGAVLAARPASAAAADPPTAADRVATLQAAALNADRRLEDLVTQLEAAIDAARRGTSLIQVGEVDPGPAFDDAAAATRIAEEAAGEAARATAALDGVLLAVEPAYGPLPPGLDSSLAGVADQLVASGEAGGPFVERRLAARATVEALADALEAMDGDDPETALADLDRADTLLATVAEWPLPPAVLPVWLETTGAMLDAARDIAEATIARDRDAAAAAVEAYRVAAEEARRADTALAISISESGSSLASTPMRRLAGALAAALAQRDAVLAIRFAGR